VYHYLCRVLYNRRNKFDPLWNSLVVAGIEPPSAAAAAADASSSSHSFLGMVGMIGTHYSDSHVTTGFANHLARPLFRCAWVKVQGRQKGSRGVMHGLLGCGGVVGMIDTMIGTHCSNSHLTTGFANHLARPLFRCVEL
jgi:hypothetical protein